jgi:hypothetical protein
VSDPADEPPGREASIEELDALLDDPGRWADVDPEKLRHLLFYRCLSYGLQPGEDSIPALMRLYQVAVERLHPAVRRQVVVHLARAAERVHREHQVRDGAGCTNALLPFLLEDPDPSVVSAAAIETALLLPLEHHDPLTGPRYVRSLIEQVSGDEAKAGIVAGLLQLGDARVSPLIADAWNVLGEEGRQTLALLVQGFHGVQVPTVEFLISWLEDESRDPHSASFGVVAATLARAGRYAGEHGVTETRRTFPLTDAPESQPFEVSRDLPRESFAPSIEERLLRVAAAEEPPQLMPHVLSYWGFDRVAYRLAAAAGALAARAATGAGSGPCEPVALELAPDWPEEPERETLIEWGIIGRDGPSINTIRVTPVEPPARQLMHAPAPVSDAGLAGHRPQAALVYTFYHPSGSASWLTALLPAGAGAEDIASTLRAVMAGNGSGGLWLLRSLPDYVHVPEGSAVGLEAVADALSAARGRAIAEGEEPVNLLSHRERLRRLGKASGDTTRKEIETRGGEFEQEDVRRDRVSEGRGADGPGTYAEWLAVAAAPAHVAAIRAHLPAAWLRAVEGASRDGAEPPE